MFNFIKRFLIKRALPYLREELLNNIEDSIVIDDTGANDKYLRVTIRLPIVDEIILDRIIPNPGGVIETNE